MHFLLKKKTNFRLIHLQIESLRKLKRLNREDALIERYYQLRNYFPKTEKTDQN